jgi:hypothetical protein
MKEGKKRGAERTQIATRNEEWSDDRLKAFLALEPPEDLPTDYNILLKAYRGMTIDLFERFVPLFVEAGHDLNTTLEDGSTFLDQVKRHRKSVEYAEVLEEAGAVTGKS